MTFNDSASFSKDGLRLQLIPGNISLAVRHRIFALASDPNLLDAGTRAARFVANRHEAGSEKVRRRETSSNE